MSSGTADADRFDLLALVIEDYEKKHWPIDPPDPRGHSLGDGVRRLLAGRSRRRRASDILARKRRLTMQMAWKLHRDWGIPAEALIQPTRGRTRQ